MRKSRVAKVESAKTKSSKISKNKTKLIEQNIRSTGWSRIQNDFSLKGSPYENMKVVSDSE